MEDEKLIKINWESKKFEKSENCPNTSRLMEYRQLLGNIVAVKVGTEGDSESVRVTLNTIAKQFVLSPDHPSFTPIFKTILTAGENKWRVVLHVDDSVNPGVLHAIECNFIKFGE